MPTAKQLVDTLFEGSRQDYSTAAKHVTKTAHRVGRQTSRNFPELNKVYKSDAKDLKQVAKHLHHGRANAARAKFHRMDTAARDSVSKGMMGHKAGKGSVQRSLDVEFTR